MAPKYKPGDRIEKLFGDYSVEPAIGIWLVGTFLCYDEERTVNARHRLVWVAIDDHESSEESSWIGHIRPAGVLDQIAWAARETIGKSRPR